MARTKPLCYLSPFGVGEAGFDFLDPGSGHLVMLGDIDMALRDLKGVPYQTLPTNDSDVATYSYLEQAKASVLTTNFMMPPVRVMDWANHTLSGLPTVDGVTLVDDDRILLMGQTTSSQNGIWHVHTGAWTRPQKVERTETITTQVADSILSSQSWPTDYWVGGWIWNNTTGENGVIVYNSSTIIQYDLDAILNGFSNGDEWTAKKILDNDDLYIEKDAAGTFVMVQEGTMFGGCVMVCTSEIGSLVGTNSLSFTPGYRGVHRVRSNRAGSLAYMAENEIAMTSDGYIICKCDGAIWFAAMIAK